MSILNIKLNVNEDEHNAILWLKTANLGQGREEGQTITKERFVYTKVEPEMSVFFDRSEALLTLIKESEPALTDTILYSREAYVERSRIKRELERKVETWSLSLCCATCCCAVCWAACCPKIDRGVDQLNEITYCEKIAAAFPEKCQPPQQKYVYRYAT